ncbi:MAG: putative DNA modification/repair radical SAM protein [Candidatus Hodarchaeota archaeon]
MNTLQKLEILGASAKYDLCASTSVNTSRINKTIQSNIGYRAPAGCCHVYSADGRCVALLKLLLTNKCTNDCYYCQNSTSCKNQKGKTSFTANELVNLFMGFYKRNYVEGLFLSSGIQGDSEVTMNKMIDIGSLLREKYRFHGYIHMKVLPGTSLSSIKAMAQFADRISLNLEAPSSSHLKELCSTKNFNSDLMTRIIWMNSVNKKQKLPAGLTSQFIVGGNEASDHDILKSTNKLYKNFDLKRIYYSAFEAVKGSKLENRINTPLLREHRLYQADWLLRVYKFNLGDILPEKDSNLSLKIDPKTQLALNTFDKRFPVEINECTMKELLYVPGIGPKSARRIMNLRKNGQKIEKESTLKKLGVVTKRAKPFIKINGKYFIRLDKWLEREKITTTV